MILINNRIQVKVFAEVNRVCKFFFVLLIKRIYA